ncbi:diacylglycerol/lipid kinase family protein [Helcobacillus massiliensis]|uniref:diacylglycerol/lipid kinase family protein n=1 Tax=Helcobacillus massiliensis TaxID=521392 RepID=UPI002554F3FE|nr:diacylglycerol kinase family protein [Helcobacillus massiliensis]MDK7741133.1 diacylglycerol kinase family protein [Helcobacillus massiliensis]WOO93941.1 diacylglycerol kinase family protein [Helcobacillus massiliensis]
MSRLRVGLLTNPTAASGSAGRIGRRVHHLLTMAGLSVVDLSGPSAEVARLRVQDVAHDLAALVVVGGDGTVALGASIVADTPVRLGIVPAGSGNDLARALGLPIGDADEAVRILLHALSRPVTPIDAIAVTCDECDQVSLAVGNVNLGFDARVNARAAVSAAPRALRYPSAVLREALTYGTFDYWIEVDGGERQEITSPLIALCNSGAMGGGLRLSPQSDPFDGRLELAVVSPLSRARLLRLLPRVYRGTHIDRPEFRTIPVTESLRIGLQDTAAASGAVLRAFSDGEPRCFLPMNARLKKGAVRILVEQET